MKSILFSLLLLSTSHLASQTPSLGRLLVVTKQSHALAIVDSATLRVVARVPIGEDPHEVVVGPDNRTAFISNYGEGTLHTLAAVDLVSHTPLQSIDIAPLLGAHGLATHGPLLWFTAEGSKALGTLDPATRRITSVVGTGQDKTHLVWLSRDGRRVIASNAGSATISVFDQETLAPSVVPGAPLPPASYTTHTWHHTLVPVHLGAEGFAVSPDEQELWAGNADGTISIIDLTTRQISDTLQAGVVGANRLSFTPDGKSILITTHTGKDLVIFDTRTRKLARRIPIEQRGASGIQIEPSGARAFIACPRDNFIAVVDLRTMVLSTTIDVGREPDGLAWWTP